ncbi:hypothetical protein L798_01659 [Zootermopsis nevadensis]|uniref:Uncharacterized protein n=1 Tax=Zootermopsis nevadensis TaxID=136037 RepID=A0A067QI27_ZOONE|nr:hypothetical protein L798_01659 [Zootermopsis nevadensis]
MAAELCLRNISYHARKVLLHAVNLRHGTADFTSPPKKVVLWIFIILKNPSPLPGLKHKNLGSSGEQANPPRVTYAKEAKSVWDLLQTQLTALSLLWFVSFRTFCTYHSP